MLNVFLVVPDLEYGGLAKQVSFLAPALRQAGHAVGVFALDATGPFAAAIQSTGIGVEHSTARDFRRWGLLRFMIPRAGDGVVHAFGLKVLRRLWLATLGGPRPKVVLSLTGRERIGRFDRRCLRAVSRLIVPHSAPAAALARQGVASDLFAVVPPVVAGAPPAPDRAEFLRSVGLPANAEVVMSAGRMAADRWIFDAVWAFEFVRYIDPHVWLLMIGDGPDQIRLSTTAAALAPEGSRARFIGPRTDLPGVLGLADVVLVPQPAGAVNVALEAMAAGRAVIAADTPDLSAIIRTGETGMLVPPRDQPAAARAMRRLLLDPELRQRLGDAARRTVRDRHAVSTAIRTLEGVYGN